MKRTKRCGYRIMAATLSFCADRQRRKLVNDAIASLTRLGYERGRRFLLGKCFTVGRTCSRRSLNLSDLRLPSVQCSHLAIDLESDGYRYLARGRSLRRGRVVCDGPIIQWGRRVVRSALLAPLGFLIIGLFAVVIMVVSVAVFTIVARVGVATAPAAATTAIAAPTAR